MPYAEIQTAIAAGGFIGDLLNRWETQRWQDNVSEQINHIIRKLDELFNNIAQMEHRIISEMYRNTVTEFSGKIQGRFEVINDIIISNPDMSQNELKEKYSDTLIRQWEEIHTDASVLRQAQVYGYGANLAVYISAIIIITCRKILGHPRNIVFNFIKDYYTPYFNDAVSVGIPYSLAGQMEQYLREATVHRSWCDSWQKRGGIGHSRLLHHGGERDDFGSGDEPDYIYYYFDIAGDIESGYTAGAVYENNNRIYGNYPEIEGITYGAEYGNSWRVARVMDVLNNHRQLFLESQKQYNNFTQETINAESLRNSLNSIIEKY